MKNVFFDSKNLFVTDSKLNLNEENFEYVEEMSQVVSLVSLKKELDIGMWYDLDPSVVISRGYPNTKEKYNAIVKDQENWFYTTLFADLYRTQDPVAVKYFHALRNSLDNDIEIDGETFRAIKDKIVFARGILLKLNTQTTQ